MSEFWDLLKYLWDSCYGFLNTSIVTIGSLDISLWDFAFGFTLLGMAIYFIVSSFSE